MKIAAYIRQAIGIGAALFLLIFLAGGAFAAAARTPCTPQSMARLVHDLQTGQVVLGGFVPKMQQQLLDQTRSTLRDAQLAQLGQLTNIEVIGIKPVPEGTICGFETDFHDTALVWQLSYDANGLISDLTYSRTAKAYPGR